MRYKENPSFDEFSRLLIELISDEPFFSKEILVPKVKALLRGFNVNLNTANYNRKVNHSKDAKRLRSLEQKQHEVKYWLDIVRALSTDEQMQQYFDEQEQMLKDKGFKN